MKIFGNYTALITPFKNNNEVDYKTLKKLVLRQLEFSTAGIVALGSTAEAPTLDSYEKHKIMHEIVSIVQNKVPIIAGVNAFSLDDALNQCHARFLDGANALLISPPPYIKPSQSALLNFFTTIANNAYIPIIIYNIPSRCGVSLSIDVCKQLSNHPNIIGIKEASGAVDFAVKLSSLASESFTIIAGNDNLLLPLLCSNAKAIISVVGNIHPQICQNIIESFWSNDILTAIQQFNKHKDLILSLTKETNPTLIKYALYKLNLIKLCYRLPLCKPTPKNRKNLSEIIEKYL